MTVHTSPIRRRLVTAAMVTASALVAGSAAVAATSHDTAPQAAGRHVSKPPFGIPKGQGQNPSKKIRAVRGDRMYGWTEQTRSEVLARHGAVATSQPLAAQAGLQILKHGGNAADAAVATAAMLGLVEPASAGIGGDMEALYYSAKKKHLYALNGAGWAPQSATPRFYRSKGLKSVPDYGVFSASVPGAVDGWSRLLHRFGRKSFRQVLKPAIETAKQGFGMTERIHGDWDSYHNFYVRMLRKDKESRKVLLRHGKAPKLYSIFRNPHLAKAYTLIAKHGRKAFYNGPIGRALVKRMNAGGAKWKMSDLSSFKSEWVKPISTNYKGYDVYETPPQTQGFATLEMLNILQSCQQPVGYNLRALGPRSPRFYSIEVQAKRLAYRDLLKYNGDPRFVSIPLHRLISKSYARSLCGRIHPGRAPKSDASTAAATTQNGVSVTTRERGDTVYLTTADRWGNMASFIYSVYDTFGSSVSVPGYGFPVNDRGSFFNLDKNSPDVIAPHKRPFLTIIPAFVMKHGRPLMSFGTMGGDEQAQAQAQEIVDMVDLGMNVQAAGDAARFHHSQDEDQVDLESHLYDLVGARMAEMGYKVRKVSGEDDVFGGYQAILFQRAPGLKPPKEWKRKGDPPVNGVYHAASDFRKDGEAVGW